MPRGLKECPKCHKSVGLRTQRCECGHQFSPPVKLADTPATAAGVIGGAPAEPPAPEPQPSVVTSGRSRVVIPAGKPPCKPKGHPWDAGVQVTDEDIASWAEQVRAAGWDKGQDYAPEAVCYFARYFWDINSQEYRRVVGVINKALHVPEYS